MFDTHCHLNFRVFENNLNKVIGNARLAGIRSIVVPGTDVESSKRAVNIASRFDGIYAAVGIHPHNVYKFQISNFKFQTNLKSQIQNELKTIESLLSNPRVVAVGEVGLDQHYYSKTKYSKYKISPEFINLQKNILKKQIDLAVRYGKSLILHNREAKKDLLEVLDENWEDGFSGRIVFHCCEADSNLLEYAKKRGIFIGVDGDVTYDTKKQEFVKEIPLEILVLETDSPFLVPESLRSGKVFPNEPRNLEIIVSFIAKLTSTPKEKIIRQTTENAYKLFRI